MTNEQREIKRKKRVLEYAERHGNVKITCRRFGIVRSTFYLWRERYREAGDEGLGGPVTIARCFGAVDFSWIRKARWKPGCSDVSVARRDF